MPFWANYHYHPPMLFTPPKAPSNWRFNLLGDAMVSGIEETHRLLRESLLEAQVRQSQYLGRMDVTLKVGNKVCVLTRHSRTGRPSKMLDYNCTGTNKVSNIINTNAYKLDLPNTLQNHNLIHVLQLDHNTLPVVGQQPSVPHLVIVDDSEECEVEQILDSNLCYQKLHYLIQWAGNNDIRTSREPLKNLVHARELLDESIRDQLNKPRM
jgi:hypothetical protein